MAGQKGYDIALLIEVVTTVLTGAAMLSEGKSWVLQPNIHAGLAHAFLGISPAGDHTDG